MTFATNIWKTGRLGNPHLGQECKMPAEPELVARFVTDDRGDPKYLPETSKGLKHYQIVIEVKNAPPDVVAATFELDPTYYLPIQTIEPDAEGRIRLETTAYGDYALKVDLRSKSGVIPVKTTLRKALLNGESPDQASKTSAAIEEIAAH